MNELAWPCSGWLGCSFQENKLKLNCVRNGVSVKGKRDSIRLDRALVLLGRHLDELIVVGQWSKI